MEIKSLIVFATALIPLLLGLIWYSKLLFGSMKARIISPLTYLFIYVLGLMISQAMKLWAIHQYNTQSLFLMQDGFMEQSGPYYEYFANFMDQYGHIHRTFSHGAAHGVLGTVLIVLPMLGILGLQQGRQWKNILIDTGYWFISLVLICGLVCAYA